MSISTPKIIILITGVLIAAFLGVIGATEFLEWRKSSHFEKKVGGLETGESTLLRAGNKFPLVELVGLDGSSINSQKLGEGLNVLYLFLSVGCDPCTEAIQSWIKFQGQIPDNVKIYGLCEDDVDYTKVYVEKTGFPFPVYCDTSHAFSIKYDMDVFPSAVGVKADRTIAFVQHGVNDKFSPLEAAQRLISEK